MTDREYWNRRYALGQDSGAGSRGESVRKKVEWLSGLPGIRRIVEVGCGDFNFGKQLIERYPGVEYVGLDVSDFVVHRNQILYPEVEFNVYRGGIPPADLILCLDVLFHITDAQQYLDEVNTLRLGTSCKYLALTAYEYDDSTTSSHVKIRKFDPSVFGTPLRREVIEKDGEMYFYLYDRSE